MNDTAVSPHAGPPASDDRFAAALRGFGLIGILAVLVVTAGNLLVPPLSAVLALLWARRSRTPWSEVGYVRPASWMRGALAGVALGASLKLALKSVVMPLLGANPINPAFHYLAGNTSAALLFVPQVLIVAGFGEETYFRGYLFERAGKLLGRGAGAKIVAVLFTSLLFGAAHLREQGVTGLEQATIVGLVFGSIYAATGRLWMLMCAHAAFDLVALAIIYWDLEPRVAHFFFR